MAKRLRQPCYPIRTFCRAVISNLLSLKVLPRITARVLATEASLPGWWSSTVLPISPRSNAMPEPTKQEIEARAYQLWERAGQPEDREAEFWHLAEQELRNQDKSSPTRTPDTL